MDAEDLGDDKTRLFDALMDTLFDTENDYNGCHSGTATAYQVYKGRETELGSVRALTLSDYADLILSLADMVAIRVHGSVEVYLGA